MTSHQLARLRASDLRALAIITHAVRIGIAVGETDPLCDQLDAQAKQLRDELRARGEPITDLYAAADAVLSTAIDLAR